MDIAGSVRPAAPQGSGLHNDFRANVKGGWAAVDPAVRDRMDTLLTSSAGATFAGEGPVRRSFVGLLFAHFCRAFGAPLVWNQGENVKVVVKVLPTANGLRCWHRTFTFDDGSEQLVQTTKVVDPKLGVLDAVGPQGERRLAMRMQVWTEDKSLHFKSSGYVFRFKRFNIKVPTFLTPGTLHAEHRDLGDGTFLYTLRFKHPLWGTTFEQEGVFRLV